jgi:Ribonuclease-III-like
MQEHPIAIRGILRTRITWITYLRYGIRKLFTSLYLFLLDVTLVCLCVLSPGMACALLRCLAESSRGPVVASASQRPGSHACQFGHVVQIESLAMRCCFARLRPSGCLVPHWQWTVNLHATLRGPAFYLCLPFLDSLPPSVLSIVERGRTSKLEMQLGYTFRNRELLLEAVTHCSWPDPARPCYQRLEFLGDVVLDFLTMRYIYNTYQCVGGRQARMIWHILERWECKSLNMQVNQSSCRRLRSKKSPSFK